MKGMTMNDQTRQTEYVEVEGGRIAYEVVGQGPLVVLSPGMADTRATYRFLAPLLADAGYRVGSVDLRGHGESSTDWDSYSHVDTANDLVAVIGKLGGPAVIMGQSFSGGAATIAAATNPDLVSAIVEIDPFTRPQKYSVGPFLHNAPYRRGGVLLGRFMFTGSVKTWSKYLNMAYPGQKPADWDVWLAALLTNLREPGRTKAARKMMGSSATLKQAGAQLADVQCPTLVLMGTNDPDFPNPEGEAAGIVGLLPDGLGRHQMIGNAGHYPHAEYPGEVAAAVIPFLNEHVQGRQHV
jgi:pimeloyl-ACP methyl ester carboxylesterase